METPSSPDPHGDRLAHATERLQAAMARASQAQEVLTAARERLALARLALQQAKAHDAHERAADDDPTRPGEIP
jgi:hypothetical protein